MSYRIIDVPVPDSATAEPGWEVRATATLLSALEAEVWGNDDFAVTARQVAAGLTHQESTLKLRTLAVPADVENPTAEDVLGIGSTWIPLQDNTSSADVWVGTRPDARRRGVGEALWQHGLAQARAHGRTVLQAWTGYAAEPAAGDPDAIDPPTGSGRVPGQDAATRFALAHGFGLEQAERHSVLEVPVDPAALARFRAEAKAKAGEDYELVSWGDAVPEQHIDSYCELLRSMSTDAPSAGLTIEEESWTAERVRQQEANQRDQGMHSIVVAALHRPSGELAGYTALQIEEDKAPPVYQDNTIVRADHRGHRLGMLLKVANLQRLATEHPQGERVHTWNAEENDYMLSINVALGFRPAGGAAAWERRLTARSGADAA